MAHTVVKPQKLAATAIGVLESEIVVPQMFLKEGIDQFRGAEDDTVNVKVPGVLPSREYGWRNDRSQPIQTDEYAERKIQVTFGGNLYSAVTLIDEQKDMDIEGWAKLLDPQARAVGRGLEGRAVSTLENADYQVVIGAADTDLPGPSGTSTLTRSIVEARRVLKRFKVPAGETRWLLVGSDFEAALQNDPEFNKASNVGDSVAESALLEATINRWKGFTIVSSDEIDPEAAYAFVTSAFIFLSAAPSVPDSVPFGATTAYKDIAMRWVRDYDPMYMRDRSVVNTYWGFRSVVDPLIRIDASHNEHISEYEHFVRGVKIDLEATDSVYPDGNDSEKAHELVTFTGVGTEASDSSWSSAA